MRGNCEIPANEKFELFYSVIIPLTRANGMRKEKLAQSINECYFALLLFFFPRALEIDERWDITHIDTAQTQPRYRY
jgi:hypothetical protein